MGHVQLRSMHIFRLNINRLHLLPVLHPYLITRSAAPKTLNPGRIQVPAPRYGCGTVIPPPPPWCKQCLPGW